MVAVAALVVEPRQADAVGDALGVVGAAVALVVFHAAPELGGAVFAQVVGQTLPDQPQLQAVVPHQTAVGIDGVQMVEKVHGAASFERVWQQYSTLFRACIEKERRNLLRRSFYQKRSW